MEGICGIITFSNKPSEDLARIGLMTSALSDGEPLESVEKIGEYWALASTGWCEDHWQRAFFSYYDGKIALTGVADIFNKCELASKINASNEDFGEILAVYYRQSRLKDCLSHIRGNFAIILLDTEKQEFYAITDHIGIRPLYYYKKGKTYFLSSRIKAIRAVCGDMEVDNNAIYLYMQYSMIPSPRTIYKNLSKLESGCYLRANHNSDEICQYWDIENQPKLEAGTDVLARRVYDCIDEAILTMKNGSKEPGEIACFLSGGTDSSAICGLLSRHDKNSLAAYSIGFPENGYDEMYYARIAASTFRLNHYEYYMRPEDVLASLPAIAAVYDEPFDNASVFPAYYCAKLAAQNNVRYMFAGDGGDEVFAGNERYGNQRVFQNYFKLPDIIRKGILEPIILDRLEKLPINLFQKAGNYIRRANIPAPERIRSYRYFTDENIFSPDFLASCDLELSKDITRRYYFRLESAGSLDRLLYTDMKLTITDNDLRKVSRMCDLAHVRVRYPLLDRNVIDLGFKIPEKLKLRGSKGLRFIFKRAFRDLLPEEILRKEKHGFGLPISQWLRGDNKIKEFAHDILFSSCHLQRGYFPKEFLRGMWALQLEDSTPYYGSVVWQLLMLEIWHRVHLEGQTL